MSEHRRPAWLVPAQYNDEPPVTVPAGERNTDDAPIDYGNGPNRSQVFGDDSYDEPLPPEPEAFDP